MEHLACCDMQHHLVCSSWPGSATQQNAACMHDCECEDAAPSVLVQIQAPAAYRAAARISRYFLRVIHMRMYAWMCTMCFFWLCKARRDSLCASTSCRVMPFMSGYFQLAAGLLHDGCAYVEKCHSGLSPQVSCKHESEHA